MPCRKACRVGCVAAALLLAVGGLSAFAQGRPDVSFQHAYETGQPVVVRGTLTTLYADDFVGRRAELLHVLRDARTGRQFTMRFDREPKGLTPGTIVQLNARAHESTLYVLADQLDAGATSTADVGVTAAATPAAADQPTLVMVTNFTDAAVSCSDASISDMMFNDPAGNSVSELYRVSSLGAVSLSGTVTDVTIPFSASDPCDIGAWADAADQQAVAKGLNPMAFAHRVYVLPPAMCVAAGYGTVGGTPSGAWVFTCDLRGVYAHELGHNLGMDHASIPGAEYGDTTDPMAYGSTRLRGVNAPHRRQLGWLGTQAVQRVTASGTHDIAALALDPSTVASPQVLEIPKPDTGDYYYLSYRVPYGFDNYIDGTYYNRLSIHEYRGDGSSSRTFLLDGLDDGASFSDPTNGITVTQVAHSATDATVQVDFDSSCAPAAPELTATPQLQSGAPGTALDYVVSVTNRDAAQCGASSFDLAAAAPSGWAVSWSQPSLTLAAGATGTAIVSVTSPTTAQAGSYDVPVSTGTSGIEAHSIGASLTYAALAPCVPGAPDFLASPASQGGPAGSTLMYTLTVTNRDSLSCAASTFALSAQLPGGWTATASTPLTIAPGASASTMVAVTSAISAAPGAYAVGVNASDVLVPTHTASAALTDIVPQPVDSTPPSTPTSLTATWQSKQKQTQLAWAPASDNVGVAGYQVLKNGAVAASVSGTGWNDGSCAAGGTYTYAVRAYDGAGNFSAASAAVTVTIPGGGRKH